MNNNIGRISLYTVGNTPQSGIADDGGRNLAGISEEDFYRYGLTLAQSLLQQAASGQLWGLDSDLITTAFVNEIIRRTTDAEAWKLLCICRADSEPNHLAAHLVNCAILAAWTGPRSGIATEKVAAFVKTAFLHDIGMMRVGTAWLEPRPLTSDERNRMASHPSESQHILEEMGCFVDHPDMAAVAADHHERADGTGYPNGKREKDISPAASLLGVIDVFDAMSHRRAHRAASLPFDAMRAVSHMACTAFPRATVRRFLQLMSIYPIGSGVRLNNRLVARVIGSNEQKPTSPILRIVPAPGVDASRENTIIDLSRETLMFIREAVNLDSLDPVFKIE